jgi:UDPglucose--hexose-1-phosphate uridylyltransferase
MQEGERILIETKHFVSFCPFVSRFPFEVHIIPKEHSSDFHEINEKERLELAKVLRETLLRIKIVLSDRSYNFIIHTSPFDNESHDYYHWHIEIMPRLTRVAGFEWGTGFYICPIPPEDAAKYLREIEV